MITLYIACHTTYIHMGAILCPPPVHGEPCIQRHAKRWQQNHSLQNFRINWIFLGEGSMKADDASFAAKLFTLHWYRRLRRKIMIAAHTKHGRQMDFSRD